MSWGREQRGRRCIRYNFVQITFFRQSLSLSPITCKPPEALKKVEGGKEGEELDENCNEKEITPFRAFTFDMSSKQWSTLSGTSNKGIRVRREVNSQFSVEHLPLWHPTSKGLDKTNESAMQVCWHH